MSSEILLVEDGLDIQELVKSVLGEHQVHVAASVDSAKAALKQNQFDMVILDVMLPDGTGFDLCSMFGLGTTRDDIAVIFLTSKSAIGDKALGFSLGADDYITKPIDPTEFRVRVNARLKKIQSKRVDNTLTCGDLKIDILAQKVFIADPTSTKTEVMDLTQMEFKLLLYFTRHEDQVLTRDQLLEAVWGNSVHVFDRTIDTHVSHLRKKLGASSYTIRSVYGSGYRFSKSESSRIVHIPNNIP